LLIGLPHALLLAVIAGIMEAIPVIGPTLGAVPAILVVVASDPSKIIWIIVATLAIQQIENTFLLPRVMDKSVGVNPVVTLLAFFTFGSLLGVMGAVMAIPIAAMIQLLLDRYIFNSPPDATQEVDGRGPHSVIQYEVQELVQDVRKHLRAKGILSGEETDRIEEEIEAIAVDLNSLLAQTDADEVTP
jgi:hypothetical protein